MSYKIKENKVNIENIKVHFFHGCFDLLGLNIGWRFYPIEYKGNMYTIEIKGVLYPIYKGKFIKDVRVNTIGIIYEYVANGSYFHKHRAKKIYRTNIDTVEIKDDLMLSVSNLSNEEFICYYPHIIAGLFKKYEEMNKKAEVDNMFVLGHVGSGKTACFIRTREIDKIANVLRSYKGKRISIIAQHEYKQCGGDFFPEEGKNFFITEDEKQNAVLQICNSDKTVLLQICENEFDVPPLHIIEKAVNKNEFRKLCYIWRMMETDGECPVLVIKPYTSLDYKLSYEIRDMSHKEEKINV